MAPLGTTVAGTEEVTPKVQPPPASDETKKPPQERRDVVDFTVWTAKFFMLAALGYWTLGLSLPRGDSDTDEKRHQQEAAFRRAWICTAISLLGFCCANLL